MRHAGQGVRKLARGGVDKKSGHATEARENSSKLMEQCANVYENKGEKSKSSKVEESSPRREPSGNPGPRCEVLNSRLRKMNEQTGNVPENKG
jgi:hypothetical protein